MEEDITKMGKEARKQLIASLPSMAISHLKTTYSLEDAQLTAMLTKSPWMIEGLIYAYEQYLETFGPATELKITITGYNVYVTDQDVEAVFRLMPITTGYPTLKVELEMHCSKTGKSNRLSMTRTA
jgi:predicted methyltransferase